MRHARKMNYPLRCQCGAIEGYVASPQVAGHAVCYCRDCQAFARFLGAPERILNDQGGTRVVATLPRHVHFTKGIDRLICMSLSDKGLLRWYAGCCRTPIGNTPRDPKISYVGLVSSCLPGTSGDLDRVFGPAKVAINTASAIGGVHATPMASLVGILKIMKNVLGARLSGAFKENPFFRPGSAEPISAPQVLDPVARRGLYGEN